MSFREHFYTESRFGGFTDIDGTILFYLRVNALLDSTSIVLDFGCGRGAYQDDPVDIRRDLRALKGKVDKVLGLDVDPIGETNPYIDSFYPLNGPLWPIASQSVDLVLCDNVLEHVGDPSEFFSEAQRVLKYNGYLCIRTSNAWSYIGILSRCIPNRFHKRLLRIAQKQRKSEDIFPTKYRCNSLYRLRRLSRKHQFSGVVYGYEADPAYLSFSRFAYWLGVLHQRFVPAVLRPTIFAFLRKI